MQNNLVVATPSTEDFGVSFNSAGHAVFDTGAPGTVGVIHGLTAASLVGFYGATPVAQPIIAHTATAQSITDALVLLGLCSQAGA